MAPVFSRKSALFLILGVFALLFGFASDVGAATHLCSQAAGSGWKNTDFSCDINYSDFGGSDLTTCQYRLYNATSGYNTGWISAGTCSGSGQILTVTITVGADPKNCRDNGTDQCKLYGKAIDNSGNTFETPEATPLRSFDIDYSKPFVNNVTSTKANGAYKAGETIDVTVDFSESVIVMGTPQLTLETGTTDAVVNYLSSSPDGTTLTFRYTVAAGHNSTDLNYASTSALALNGGTIKDAAENLADMVLPALDAANSLGENRDIVIDTTAPTITKVSSDKASGSYTVGEVIDIDVTFSEVVTSTDGNVTVTLETGTIARACVFTVPVSVPGAVTGTCNYIVQIGDMSAGLTVASISSISGIIKDVALNTMTNFVPTTNLTANKAIVVDTIAPTVNTFDVIPKDPAWVNVATPNTVVSWTVSDTGGANLKQIEVWRAFDNNPQNGVPDAAEWGSISTYTGPFDTPASDSGTYTDTGLATDGTYWYGLHVKDNALNCITEDTSGADKGHCGGAPSDGLDTRPDMGPVKVIVDKTAPGTPSLFSPMNNSSTFDTTPTFDWSDVTDSNGVTYGLLVDNNSNFTSPEINQTGVGSSTYTPGSGLAAGTYFWKVRATDGAENSGTYSATFTFVLDTTAPKVDAFDVSPKDPAWVNGVAGNDPPTDKTTISWTVSDTGGAHLKQVEVWRAFDTNLNGVPDPAEWGSISTYAGPFDGLDNDSGTYTDITLSTDGTYWYGLHAKDNAQNCITEEGNLCAGGAPSDGVTRTDLGPIKVIVDKTAPTKPGTPSTPSPTNDTTPKWDWTVSTDTGGSGVWRYWVWWATDPDFTQNFHATLKPSPPSPPFTHITPLAEGTWYMKVRALDRAGNWSAEFSDTGQVDIILNQAPASPTSPLQFKNDETTAISNQGFTNELNVKLRASATDPDAPEIIRLFFEVALNSESFVSPATPTTGTSCASGTVVWSSCSSKIWYVFSVSGNFSSTPFVGTANITDLPTATGYKWQVKACDDDNACSSWVLFNAATPNFSADTTPPVSTVFLPDFTVDTGSWQTTGVMSRLVYDTSKTNGGSPFDEDACQYRVTGLATTTSLRNCSSGPSPANIEISVGPDETNGCNKEGENACVLEVLSYDTAGNQNLLGGQADGDDGLVAYSIDWQAPTVGKPYVSYDPDQGDDIIPAVEGDEITLKGDVSDSGGIANCDLLVDGLSTFPAGGYMEPSESPCTGCTMSKNYTFEDLTDSKMVRLRCWDQYNSETGDPSHITLGPEVEVVKNNAPEISSLSFTTSGCPMPTTQEGCEVHFELEATDADGDALTFAWIFGDDTVSVEEDPFHHYDTADTYAVIVNIYDGRGGQETGGLVVSVGDPTLSVELGADPPSGTTNTNFDLSSQVAGTAAGLAKFKFDCTNDGWDYERDDIDLSVSDPGWIQRPGDGNTQTKVTAPDTFAVQDLCQYSTPGTYTAKVFVQRGVGTAEDTVDIVVSANNIPEARNPSVDSANPTDYCGVTGYPPVRVRWVFSDADPGDTQGAYELEVFQGAVKVVDTGKGIGTTQEYVFQSPGEQLLWDTTYTWQVRVWDSSNDDVSAFVSGPQFTTVRHHYPVPNFTWSPALPSAQASVQFCSRFELEVCPENETIFAPDSSNQSFSWDFGDSGSSVLQNPTHTYAQTGAFGVTLQAGDDIGSCPNSQTVNVSIPFPEWQEISPF